MFHQTFPQEIGFLLKIKGYNFPQPKNFRNSQKFPRTMSACPRLFPFLINFQAEIGGFLHLLSSTAAVVKTSCFDSVPSNYFLRTEGKTPATC